MIVSFVLDGKILARMDIDVIPSAGEFIVLPSNHKAIQRYIYKVAKVTHSYRVLKEESNLVICTTLINVIDA